MSVSLPVLSDVAYETDENSRPIWDFVELFGNSTLNLSLDRDAYLLDMDLEIEPQIGYVQSDPEMPYIFGGGDVNGDGYDDVLRVEYVRPDSAFSITGNRPGAGTHAVDLVGDLNGDGHEDLAVGRIYNDSEGPGTETGCVDVFYGSSTGLGPDPDLTVGYSRSSSEFGKYVSGADVNGDGYDDLVIGSESSYFTGQAMVMYGGPDGLSETNSSLISSNYPYVMNEHVMGVGDVNGDGFDDVCGLSIWAGGGNVRTRVDLFLGSSSGMSFYPNQSIDLPPGVWELRPVGDVTGDGSTDIAVSDEDHDGEYRDQGIVELLFGNETGLNTTNVVDILGNAESINLGASVCGVSDLNGDGYNEVMVMALNERINETRIVGSLQVFLGRRGGVAPTPRFTIYGGNTLHFARLLYPVGDVDSNGLTDVALVVLHVGAPVESRYPSVFLRLFKGRDLRVRVGDETVLSEDGVDLGRKSVPLAAAVNRYIDGNKAGVERGTNVTVPVSLSSDDHGRYMVDWREPRFIIVRSPLNVSAYPLPAGGAVNISWEAEPDDGTNLLVYSNSSGEWESVANVTASTRSVVLQGLENTRRYFFKMRALNAPAGRYSDYTPVISVVPRDELPPPTPVISRVETIKAGNQLRIVWTATGADTDHYLLYRRHGDEEALVANLSYEATSFLDTDLVDGETYYYWMRSVDPYDNQSPPSDEKGGIPRDTQPPEAPGGVRVSNVPGGNAVQVSWEANQDDTVSYSVHLREKHNDLWIRGAEVGADVLSVALGDLVNGVTYQFKVVATDEAGLESPPSDIVEAQPLDTVPPAAPTDFLATPGEEDGSVVLEWSSDDEEVVKFEIRSMLTNRSMGWVYVPDTSWAVIGLETDHPYTFGIRAYDDDGLGSALVTSDPVWPTDLVPPEVPTIEVPYSLTNEVELTVEGRGEPNSTVECFIGDERVAETGVGEDGTFSLTMNLLDGENVLRVRSLDRWNNTSGFTRESVVTLDRDAPVIVSITPVNGSAIEGGTVLEITCDEDWGSITYQVTLTSGNTSIDLDLDEDGGVLTARISDPGQLVEGDYWLQVNGHDAATNGFGTVFGYVVEPERPGDGTGNGDVLVIGIVVALVVIIIAMTFIMKKRRWD